MSQGEAYGFVKWVSGLLGKKGFATSFAIGVIVAVGGIIWFLDPASRTVANVSAVVQSGAIIIGLLSIVLLSRQIRATADWSSVLSYHQFFGDLITVETRRQLQEVAVACGFQKSREDATPIVQESIKTLQANPAHSAVVAAYLDEFEEFAAAVHAGVVQERYAYRLEGNRLIRTWQVFGPYIEACRQRQKDAHCYLEIEKLGTSWHARRQSEVAAANSKNGVSKLFG
ncbi:DUF4760 domain-containing protein [Xanthomonas arboricola]|uniref:DUF4760 domain-containing protein n=1 Tax=Xanthomonas arboricola TaxID=56448 RepID=UPI001608127B|nr:DUF4760 domain-containing protein [Xanthomonas arboricola]MBB4726328.1 hypothetical protein [Xanthomonas arboricola]